MPRAASKKTAVGPAHGTDSRDPRILILRAGLLDQDGNRSFCLVKDISPSGIRAKLYSSGLSLGPVVVRIADEDASEGQIAWISDGHAGISFDDQLALAAVQRLSRRIGPSRRRSMARLPAPARVLLRMGGRSIPAELCDISSFGAKVRTKRELTANRAAMIDLPNLPSISAYVRWSDGCESGLLFATPIPMQVIGHWIDDRLRVSA